MKIGVVGTCQAPGIGIGLQQLLPDDQVVAIEGTAARRENYLNEAAAILHDCPIVFGHHLADDFGPLSTAALRHSHCPPGSPLAEISSASVGEALEVERREPGHVALGARTDPDAVVRQEL